MARESRRRPILEPGLIVWAEIVDPQGRNPKARPVVLLTGKEDTRADDPLTAVAITATLPKPLPDFYVLLPWHRSGHPMTGLKKRCAAACNWIAEVQQSVDLEVIGRLPDQHFADVLAAIKRFRDHEDPATS
jgi:mRNA-degrading endonuclease toxin of MazEF toxin-antitoxin module